MQRMLDMRTYGLKIHYNTTSMGNVDWVGNQVLYKDIQFTIAKFYGMVSKIPEDLAPLPLTLAEIAAIP